jgi:hypothetical protein
MTSRIDCICSWSRSPLSLIFSNTENRLKYNVK